MDYQAYGNVARERVRVVNSPLRFQGQYFDEETGLHYNRHRYYSPETGRFITVDPIGLAGGLNNYQYAKNPTGWVDPLGLEQISGDCPKKIYASLDELNKLRGTGANVGDLSNISGARIQDIIANIPENSTVRKLTPSEGRSQMGLEYSWIDAEGVKNRLRIHDPDPSHPGSNSANGWIARWQKRGGYYDPVKGKFAHKNAHKENSPHYDPEAANNTHIPIQTPELWLMSLMKIE